MPNIGPVELIIVLVIVLIVFGARRVPEAGKNLGKGMREFKDAITGRDDDRKALEASNQPKTSGQATAPPEQAVSTQQQPPAAPIAAPAPPPHAEESSEHETARSGEFRG